MSVNKVSRLSIQVRNLILQYAAALLSTVRIEKLLKRNHNVQTTRQAIRSFLIRFKKTGTVADLPKKRASRVTTFHKQMMNMWLSENCELTSRVIRDKFQKLFNLKISCGCVSRIRRELGWTTRRVKYCQLISHQNKIKRLDWCLSALDRKETFENVIFVDETTVEMSANGKLFFYQPNSNLQHLPARKQKPKHSYKVCTVQVIKNMKVQ